MKLPGAGGETKYDGRLNGQRDRERERGKRKEMDSEISGIDEKMDRLRNKRKEN